MSENRLSVPVTSAEETCACAATLARRLAPADIVLLTGPVGAGKSHFARCAIQSVMEVPEDVPSPTYTLVQTYSTRCGEIWHADLYRVSSRDELVELGFEDAFETAISMIEWPERVPGFFPETALTIAFEPGPCDDARELVFTWKVPRWDVLLAEDWNA